MNVYINTVTGVKIEVSNECKGGDWVRLSPAFSDDEKPVEKKPVKKPTRRTK